MKKKVILLSSILVIFAICFIPFTQQKTVTVNASFFNVYQQLAKARNWEKWRGDLRNAWLTDSTKISGMQDANGFKLNYANIRLNLNIENGYTFKIKENNGNKEFDYSYTVLAGKYQDTTSIILTEKTNGLNYLLNKLNTREASQTHITDFKNFMENPSLYYGYEITKTKVTDTNIVVLRRIVLAKDKFNEAAKTLNTLKQYVASNGLKQTQPLIAQFIPKNGDSSQVNIGLPINSKAFTKNHIVYMMMPKNGNIYSVKFHGKFNERQKVYAVMQQFFHDKAIQAPAVPFETYLDDKLPASDTAQINIQVNFPSL
jgi:effector-binding domain-containing protein